MTHPSARQKQKGRKETGTFLMLPTAVLNCPRYRLLSYKAKALITDIGARYNGFNNGNLAAPWTWMKVRGWPSKDTLSKAKEELLRMGFIDLTRQGGLHGPSLYAFTWLPVDPCKAHLDIHPTRVASGRWNDPIPAPSTSKKTELPPRISGESAPAIGQDQLKRRAA